MLARRRHVSHTIIWLEEHIGARRSGSRPRLTAESRLLLLVHKAKLRDDILPREEELGERVSPLPELCFAEIPTASQHRYVGNRFSYMESGRRNADPVLLLHGIGGNGGVAIGEAESLDTP